MAHEPRDGPAGRARVPGEREAPPPPLVPPPLPPPGRRAATRGGGGPSTAAVLLGVLVPLAVVALGVGLWLAGRFLAGRLEEHRAAAPAVPLESATPPPPSPLIPAPRSAAEEPSRAEAVEAPEAGLPRPAPDEAPAAPVSRAMGAPPPRPQPPEPDAAAFVAAMSEGLAALDREDFEVAREAFERARALRPGSPQSAEGLARAEAGARRRTLGELRRRALDEEAAESWHDAAETYAAILDLDPTVAFAREGLERSGRRAELTDRLAYHLAHPDRLSSPEVLEEASQLLFQAREAEPAGPRLESRVRELGRLVEAYSRPVRVVLTSDGETEVTVYRVGRLGTFDRRSLELRPGTYTVVGSRRGFRDVRHRLVVRPGEEPEPLAVACEEEI